MRYRLEYLGLKGLLYFFAALPLDMGLRWGSTLGRIWYALDRKHRELAVDNISRALGLSPSRAAAVARRNFENLGRNMAEFAAFQSRERELLERVEVERKEILGAALERHKGVFFLSGHFGNWELGGAYMSRLVSCSIVVRRMKNPLTDVLINDLRRRVGGRVISHRNSSRLILSALRKGEGVGILLDQKAHRREGVFVNFLGRPASTNFGLALLAAKSEAPVLPLFIVREGVARHRLIFHPPVDLVRLSDRQEELGVNTARFTAVIEEYVRRYPEQWFWVHNRWKNQPRRGERVYGS
jgi:KDO2-lipid IV(A) lauroyltransferase